MFPSCSLSALSALFVASTNCLGPLVTAETFYLGRGDPCVGFVWAFFPGKLPSPSGAGFSQNIRVLKAPESEMEREKLREEKQIHPNVSPVPPPHQQPLFVFTQTLPRAVFHPVGHSWRARRSLWGFGGAGTAQHPTPASPEPTPTSLLLQNHLCSPSTSTPCQQGRQEKRLQNP